MGSYKIIMEHIDMNIDKKLYTLKYTPDINSHLHPNLDDCKECNKKPCTFICPAQVYEWDDENKKLIVNFENCLECGACRIVCEKKSLGWEYPKGTKGVTFKNG